MENASPCTNVRVPTIAQASLWKVEYTLEGKREEYVLWISLSYDPYFSIGDIFPIVQSYLDEVHNNEALIVGIKNVAGTLDAIAIQ